jgi:hypothetical protein
MIHGPMCPIVKSIEYFEDGITVKRVEFTTAADYKDPLADLKRKAARELYANLKMQEEN